MLYIRRITGHSMLPGFLPGRIVLGLRRWRHPKPGQVVILVHEGKEKIKRVSKVDGDQIYVLGDHSDSSTDSRHFGWIGADAVKAVVIWPR